MIDPQRDVDQYVEDARSLGLEIRYVFPTHFHADFISGHLELRDQVGAEIRMGGRATADYAIIAMPDGDILEFGSIRLRSLETPGHTPECTSIAVYDQEASSTEPHAVFTGDTLVIGDVGLPDLLASLGWTASDLASMLYDSLHKKLLTLPDDTLVYPAHGAGSACGRNLSTARVLDHRHPTAVQLRVAADEQGGVHRTRHGRSARGVAVLRLRCGAQPARTANP